MNTQSCITAYLAACKAGGRSLRTLKQYRWALRHLPPEMPTSAEQIEAVLARDEWCGTSKLAVYRVLHAFMGWSGARFNVPNPMKAVVRPKAEKRNPSTFDQQQLRLIWANCNTEREQAMARLLLDSGARLGEAANLREGDVKGSLVQLRGKTGERTGFVSLKTSQMLQRARRGQAFFAGRRGPLTASGLYQSFKAVLARAKITGRRLGPHTMRHTFATEFLKAGGNVFALKELLGHSSLRTTEIYVHLTQGDIGAAHGSVGLASRLLDGAAA